MARNTGIHRVINGTWYEVCVIESGEIRDVVVKNSIYDASKCADTLAKQWPDCSMVFVRQHRADPKHGPGASTYCVLHKMTLDFRPPRLRLRANSGLASNPLD